MHQQQIMMQELQVQLEKKTKDSGPVSLPNDKGKIDYDQCTKHQIKM